MSMLAMWYVVALIVGGGLIFVSTVLGSHGTTDVHADLATDGGLDHDMGGDAHDGTDVGESSGHPLSLATWFSMQFAVYFLAIFGLIGTALTYVAQAEPSTVFASSVIGGFVVGQVVHQVLRALKRSSVQGDLTAEDYVGQVARVSVALDGTHRGEVALASRNGERFLAALARRGDDRFKVGDHVVVVGFVNGVAEVVSQKEHDFVAGVQSGETV